MARNLVICCDGTTNEIATDSTNVLRIYRCLTRDDSQIVYYDCGVGVIANSDRISHRGRRVSRILDSAMGLSVGEHVLEAYQFLVKHYQPDDQIFLFGFSRGAYTARGIAGLIRFLGLLRPELAHLSEMAWSVYSGENADHSLSMRFQGGNRFRKSFCVNAEVPIHFVGVWDTVSSFGWINDLRTLPHTADNSLLTHIRHALAIDERRTMFQPNHFRPEKLEQHESIKEVWFAGCHCDVGGGYPEQTGTLSKVSLEWMLREAEACGLRIDESNRQHIMNNPPNHPLADEFGDIHESLVKFWHLFEFIPRRSFSANRGRKIWKRPNLWARRTIESVVPEVPKPILHHSVINRMNQKEGAYHPQNLPPEFDVES